MKRQNIKPLSGEENELDLRALCRALWYGKIWIITVALLLALLALAYSVCERQVWSATATTERPGMMQLGSFYTQRQFLRQQLPQNYSPESAQEVMNEVYKEFILQLSSWDTRRDFWLQSSYYQQRKTGEVQQDAIVLDRLISNIRLQPADPLKGVNDTIHLVAENAHDASQLLDEYVQFANRRAVTLLQQSLSADWTARQVQLQAEIVRQEMVAKAVYERRQHKIEQALAIARRQGVTQNHTSRPPEQLPDDMLFQAGTALLQARLENLQAIGPSYDQSYDQNRALLISLAAGPDLNQTFQSWRYLRTPEQPVTRDSPRRGYLMALWGSVGALTGAGITLARRRVTGNKRDTV